MNNTILTDAVNRTPEQIRINELATNGNIQSYIEASREIKVLSKNILQNSLDGKFTPFVEPIKNMNELNEMVSKKDNEDFAKSRYIYEPVSLLGRIMQKDGGKTVVVANTEIQKNLEDARTTAKTSIENRKKQDTKPLSQRECEVTRVALKSLGVTEDLLPELTEGQKIIGDMSETVVKSREIKAKCKDFLNYVTNDDFVHAIEQINKTNEKVAEMAQAKVADATKSDPDKIYVEVPGYLFTSAVNLTDLNKEINDNMAAARAAAKKSIEGRTDPMTPEIANALRLLGVEEKDIPTVPVVVQPVVTPVEQNSGSPSGATTPEASDVVETVEDFDLRYRAEIAKQRTTEIAEKEAQLFSTYRDIGLDTATVLLSGANTFAALMLGSDGVNAYQNMVQQSADFVMGDMHNTMTMVQQTKSVVSYYFPETLMPIEQEAPGLAARVAGFAAQNSPALMTAAAVVAVVVTGAAILYRAAESAGKELADDFTEENEIEAASIRAVQSNVESKLTSASEPVVEEEEVLTVDELKARRVQYEEEIDVINMVIDSRSDSDNNSEVNS